MSVGFDVWLGQDLFASFNANPAAIVSRATTASPVAPTLRDRPATAMMHEFVVRPLFRPARRPAPKKVLAVAPRAAVPSKPAPPPVPEPALTLLGVVVTPAGREAIVRIDDVRSESLAEGASIGSWSLTHVLEDRAIFATPHGARELVFQPHVASASATERSADASLAAFPAPPARRRR